MTHAPRQSYAITGGAQRRLVLRLAADLRGVSGRLADLRGLCLHQLSDLRAIMQTITAIGAPITAEPGRAGLLPALSALIGEMAELHGRFQGQVAAGRRIADDFLLVAREIEEDAASIRSSGSHYAEGVVVSLPAHRSAAANAAAARSRVDVLSGSLRCLDAALAALSEAQARSVPDMEDLRARVAAFARQAPISPA